MAARKTGSETVHVEDMASYHVVRRAGEVVESYTRMGMPAPGGYRRLEVGGVHVEIGVVDRSAPASELHLVGERECDGKG